jgi:hypothetical protein
MDPTMMPSILHALIPIFSVLAVFGCPVGIIWVVKNHQYRMKELELESRRAPPDVEHRLASVEARLGAIEAALTAPAARNALADRASLLEGPPVSDPVRQR